jgi:quercetin dioxygenase-like cupin family protein
MNGRWALAGCLAGLCLVAPMARLASAAGAANPLRWVQKEAQWRDGPLPGTKVSVLEGNPQGPGLFTLRLRLPPKFLLRSHTHPQDERVTVLSGSVNVAFNGVDVTQAPKFDAGDFYVNPAGVEHVVYSATGAVLQMTGVGPWEVHFRGDAGTGR